MSLTVAHLSATWFMVGLIWVVQVVHYPLFRSVGAASLARYEARHTVRMGRLIVIPATLEVLFAALLVTQNPAGIEPWAAWLAGVLLAAIWVVTLLVQVPLHRSLSASPDPTTIDRLVLTNWVRTAAWTARGVLAAGFLI